MLSLFLSCSFDLLWKCLDESDFNISVMCINAVSQEDDTDCFFVLTQTSDIPNVHENSLSHSANSPSIELMTEMLSKYGMMCEVMESRATMKG